MNVGSRAPTGRRTIGARLGVPRLLRKLDFKDGTCELVEHAKLFESSATDLTALLRKSCKSTLPFLANLAGNDFCKFDQISLVTAIAIAQRMRIDDCIDFGEAVRAAAELGHTLPENAEERLADGMVAYTSRPRRARPMARSSPRWTQPCGSRAQRRCSSWRRRHSSLARAAPPPTPPTGHLHPVSAATHAM